VIDTATRLGPGVVLCACYTTPALARAGDQVVTRLASLDHQTLTRSRRRSKLRRKPWTVCVLFPPRHLTCS